MEFKFLRTRLSPHVAFVTHNLKGARFYIFSPLIRQGLGIAYTLFQAFPKGLCTPVLLKSAQPNYTKTLPIN